MKRFPAGSRPSTRPNPDWFTGDVWMDTVIGDNAPSRVSSLIVRFDPGARTAWHTHPLGQTIHILSGKGLVCRRSGTPETILPGDTVYFEPDEEHWHGACSDVGMTHIAMQEADETGSPVTWLEHVSDEDYLA